MTTRADRERWAALPIVNDGDAVARIRMRQVLALPQHLAALGVSIPDVLARELNALHVIHELEEPAPSLDDLAARLAAGEKITQAHVNARRSVEDMAQVSRIAYGLRYRQARTTIVGAEGEVLDAVRPVFVAVLDDLAGLAKMLPDSVSVTPDALLGSGNAAAAEAVYTQGRSALSRLGLIGDVRSALWPDWPRAPYAWLREHVEPLRDTSGQPVPLGLSWSWPNVLAWVATVRHHRDALWLPSSEDVRRVLAQESEHAERLRRQHAAAAAGSARITGY